MADAGDVVKRITITATGVDIDSTASSLNSLADAYDNAASKSQDALSVLGAAGAIGGLIASFGAVLDYVGKTNSELANMATVANQVGLSLKDFQSIQFGGQVAGLNTDQINAGLQQSATLLNDASRNSNTLSKELTANGLSVKDTNGQLISQNQLLGIAANLISNAKNPGDAAAIAQMLGFTKEWIPLLEQGSTALTALGPAAQSAGAIIDDATIARAQQFDTEWRKSSTEFSAYMKSSLADLLPYFDDLIDRAAKFMKSISAADIQKASDDTFKQFNDATGIPEGGVIKVDADGLSTATKEFQSAPIFDVSTWVNFGKAIAQGFQLMSPQQAGLTIPGYTASQLDGTSYSTFQGAGTGAKDAATQAAALVKADDAAIDAQSDLEDKFSAVAAKSNDANDAVDRAINTLNRHTQQTQADANAVGLGAAALATFRAQAQETAAVQANGGQETADQAKHFAELQVAAGAAADALAKANAASVISRGSQTAFLSPEDLAIANQLKTIYGDNIPAAMASSQAAALRMNNVLSTINTTIRTGATTFATDFVESLTKGESLMQSLQTAAAALGKTLLDAGLKTLVTDGLNALSGPASSLASSAGLTAGATTAAATLTAAGTAAGAAIAAGATSAATILGTGGVASGAAVTTGGTVAGAATAVGGATAGTELTAGGVTAGAALTVAGTTAGAALWGPIAALGAVAAGVGLSLFGNSNDDQQAANNKAFTDQANQINADNASRRQQDQFDAANAQLSMGSDPNSLQGQLASFDLQAQQQIIAENQKGNGAIVELEQSLADQRLAIIQKSNEAITKSMDDFLNSVKTGSLSTLSPADQLAYEQNLFNTQLAGAKGGNSDDISALTGTAQTLLTLAQNFYASGTGYDAVFKQVTTAISALAADPSGAIAANPLLSQNTQDTTQILVKDSDGNIVNQTVGMAEGGIVGNGIFNKDSVIARYAGGGNIALAGGEAVTRASSVNAGTIGMLNHINRTGKTPSNDNSDVVATLAKGFNGLGRKLDEQTAALAGRVKALEDTTRQTSNKRRVPGTRAA